MRFGTVIVDPPWPYQRTSQVGRDGKLTGYSDQKYEPLSLEVLAGLPVGEMVSNVLLLWTTGAMVPHAVRLVDAWGFQYVTMMFWHKSTVPPQGTLEGSVTYRPHYGVGYWFRGDTEPVVVAKKPATRSYRTNERATVVSERLAHSRKPVWLHELAEKHFPGPYLELFARRRRRHWVCLGDAISGRDIREDMDAFLEFEEGDA